MAVDALRANKVRAVLTSIGVIIGSASIVLVVTVALTSQKFVISQIEAMGSNLVWVEMIKTPEKAQPLSYEINTDDLAAAKAQISDAQIVAGFNDLPMAVVVSGRTRPVRLIGVTDGYQQIRRLLILRGPLFRLRGHGIAQQGLPDHQGPGRPRVWRGESRRPGNFAWAS